MSHAAPAPSASAARSRSASTRGSRSASSSARVGARELGTFEQGHRLGADRPAGGDRLEAALAAAGAAPAGADGTVAELADGAARADQQPPAGEDAGADAVGEEDQDGVVVVGRGAREDLADDLRGRQAEQPDGNAERVLEDGLHRHAVPPEARVGDRAGVVVDEARARPARRSRATRRSAAGSRVTAKARKRSGSVIIGETLRARTSPVAVTCATSNSSPYCAATAVLRRAVEAHERARPAAAVGHRAGARLDHDRPRRAGTSRSP